MPVGLVIIIGAVYSILFNANYVDFIPSLFSGLTPWLFIVGSADGGTYSLLSAEGYLKQTTVSGTIYPLRVCLVNFINYLFSSLGFFAIYLIFLPSRLNVSMLMFIPASILLLVFGIALSNLAAIANLNFRDYQPLQSLALQGFFYATPIIYMPEMLAQKGFALVYQLNPFYYYIEIVRKAMVGEGVPGIDIYLPAIIIASFMLFASIVIIARSSKTIVFKL